LSKQIETPATEEQGSQYEKTGAHDSGETALPPFPPRPDQGQSHANGWDVASQYRAIQEAQRLHEETIKQLREEVQYQKERLSELSESAGSGRTPQLDAVFLRLSELERKIGQDAPDPLLNEIVHRLAALENSPHQKQSGKDSRVDDLVEQVEKLRRRAAEPAGDARVDDVVLRIASLESANKRGNYALEIEGLANRLQEARTELEQSRRADLSVFQQELQSLAERVGELSESADQSARFEAVDKRIEEFQQASLEARAELEAKLDGVAEKIPAPVDPEQERQRWQALESRLEALEDRPAPATPEALEELAESVAGLREQLEALRERSDDIPAPQRLLDLDARLDELGEKIANPEAAPETAALRTRVEALEDRSADTQELTGRLTALEQAAAEPAPLPAEWADKVERIAERLDGLEDLAERVAKVEEFNEESNQAGLLELTSRMRALEITVEDLGDISGLATGLREEIAELRQGGSVGELRTELEALREQSARDESEELRTRIAEAESRLSDIESLNRIEGASPRLDALEEKLRGLDDLSDVRRRLTVLEMESREEGSTRNEELVARLEALEARPAAAESSATESAETADRLAAVQSRVADVEGRLEAIADVSVDADTRARLDSLVDEIELLKQNAASIGSTGAVADPRISEMIDRLDWMERSASGSGVDLEPLRLRIEALEQRPEAGDGGDSGVRHRMQEVLDRLDQLENLPPGDAGVALQKESERWSQWARSTLEEIGELRRQVEEAQKKAAVAPNGGAAGLDAETIEALGLTISSGLAKGEVRNLRQQMYFIYFAIGTLLALAVLFLFMNLTS